MNRPDWQIVERRSGPCWLHKSGVVWVVHYPLATPPHYQAYKVADYIDARTVVKRGRDPWTVDNRALRPDGFRTLEGAQQAAEKISVDIGK
jgi:hypothetical protein